MRQTDYHPVVGEAPTSLIDGLAPLGELVFAAILPPGAAWTDLLRSKDLEAGRRVGEYRHWDLSLMLRAMTERLGNVGYPFGRRLPRQAENYASELRDVGNRWAHNEQFTTAQAYRAIDTVELLFEATGAEDDAAQVAALKHAIPPVGDHDGQQQIHRDGWPSGEFGLHGEVELT